MLRNLVSNVKSVAQSEPGTNSFREITIGDLRCNECEIGHKIFDLLEPREFRILLEPRKFRIARFCRSDHLTGPYPGIIIGK